MKRMFLVGILVALVATTAFGIELDVQFISQEIPRDYWAGNPNDTRNCGPTSLLMVAAYNLGFELEKLNIKDINDWMVFEGVITDHRNYLGQYISAEAIALIASNYYGFQQVIKHNSNSLALLEQALSNNNPVIVGVQIRMGEIPSGHFMVLTGITDTEVIVNDPGRSLESGFGDGKHYPISTFLASWATQNYCAIIIDGNAGRSNIVAQKADGSVNSEILSAYHQHGGQQTLGTPVARTIAGQSRPATVWEWELCYTQVFDGGDLGECAIVYDRWVNCSEAFPIHGQLWNYYKANDGPNLLIEGTRIGGPINQERYVIDSHNGHQLAVQEMANGWLVYDTATGFCDARSKDNPGFTISLLPGVTEGLNLAGWALDDSSIFVSVNNTEASIYELYVDGSYYGDLENFELTVAGLSPNTINNFT